MKIRINKLNGREITDHTIKVMTTVGIGSVMDMKWYRGKLISPTLPSSFMAF